MYPCLRPSFPNSDAQRYLTDYLGRRTRKGSESPRRRMDSLRRPLSQDRPCRRSFMPSYFHRQHDEVVVAGRYLIEDEAFDDRDSLAEQSLVCQRRGRSELLGRDVVYANELHSGVGEQPRRIWSDVGEVAMKSGVMHPSALRASGAEEHARDPSPF